VVINQDYFILTKGVNADKSFDGQRRLQLFQGALQQYDEPAEGISSIILIWKENILLCPQNLS